MRFIFVTARLKSTRLPGKALLDIDGQPLLAYQIRRLRASTSYPIVLCTSTHVQDDPLESFAKKVGLPCFRGSEEDVLDRYLQCAKAFGAAQMYITYADEPLLDIELIDATFKQLDRDSPVWVNNSDYPDGCFGYGLNKKAIAVINKKKLSTENEVWGPMVAALPIQIVKNALPVHWDKASYRLTVDYPEDLDAFTRLGRDLGDRIYTVGLDDIFAAYDRLGLLSVNGFRNAEYQARLAMQGEAAKAGSHKGPK